MTQPAPITYAGLSVADREKLDGMISTIYRLQTHLHLLAEALARTPDVVFAIPVIGLILLENLYERFESQFDIKRH